MVDLDVGLVVAVVLLQLQPGLWKELTVRGLDKVALRERRRAAVEARQLKEAQVRQTGRGREGGRGRTLITLKLNC